MCKTVLILDFAKPVSMISGQSRTVKRNYQLVPLCIRDGNPESYVGGAMLYDLCLSCCVFGDLIVNSCAG